MRLTTKGRYAVTAMVDIAYYGNVDKPIPLYEIAERCSIKLNYLEQIFLKLKRSKLVESVKGPGGGYYIAKDVFAIKIIDIVNAVSEPIAMTRCLNAGGGCTLRGKKCLTHHLWDGLSNQIFLYLNNISLKDICDGNKAKFYE